MADIPIPDHVLSELLESISDTLEILGQVCETCDDEGAFSYAQGHLSAMKNVVEHYIKKEAKKE